MDKRSKNNNAQCKKERDWRKRMGHNSSMYKTKKNVVDRKIDIENKNR